MCVGAAVGSHRSGRSRYATNESYLGYCHVQKQYNKSNKTLQKTVTSFSVDADNHINFFFYLKELPCRLEF